MNSNLRRTSGVVVVLVLVLVGVLLQSFWGDAAARSNGEGRLQGTWRVKLNPRNCQTGGPGAPPFSLLLSFHRGSTLTEAMNPEAFLPGQRTPGLGVWSHAHDNAYKAVWEAFILFDSPTIPPRFKRGVQRLMWDIEVDGDQLTIEASSQFFDTNGNLLAATCGSATGTRFEGGKDED